MSAPPSSDPKSAARRRGLAGALLFVAGAVLGTGGGYVAKRAPQDETRFLNFDVESTPAEALVEGWSSFEATRAGDTFAWCTQRTCAVRVLVHAPGDRVVRFRAFPFRYEGAPPQQASVTVNGRHVATIPLPGGESVSTFSAERGFWKRGANEVRFDLSYAEAPADHDPASNDGRRLSVALDWIEVIGR